MKNLILFSITLLFSATSLSAKTITVTSGADSGTGTLRQAIMDAEPNDSITFAENVTSVYFAEIIIIDKNITINGNETNNTIFQNAAVWINNTNRKRYFLILANTEVTFNHLTMKDNMGNCGGGAINNAGNLTLNNCIFSNNQGYDAAGAVMSSGDLTVMNCIFSDNVVPLGAGGAISCHGEGNTTITNSSFIRNKANTSGGAIRIDSKVSVVNCIFEGNTSPYGGAVSNYGTTNIDNCIFRQNKATSCGIIQNRKQINVSSSDFYRNESRDGIFYNDAKATVSNCLFHENIGNIWYIILNEGANDPGTLTLVNSTIADNTGIGLYNRGYSRAGYATLRNNIFSNNSSDDVYVENAGEPNIIASNNLIGASNINLSGNNNLIGENPLFVGSGDYSLQAESPAIDRGNNTYVSAEITNDLAGNPRISNITVDLGAYENQERHITSLSNTPNEQLNVYVQNRNIIVENAADPVSVYNMLGHLMAQGVKTEFTVPHVGVYIVKTGNKAIKIMVQ